MSPTARTSSLTSVFAACPTTQDITYDGANQALDDTSGATITYDLNGNLANRTPGRTGSGTNTMTYAGTGNNELLSVISGGSTTSVLNSPLGISAITIGGSTKYVTRDPPGAVVGNAFKTSGGILTVSIHTPRPASARRCSGRALHSPQLVDRYSRERPNSKELLEWWAP